MLPIFLRPDGTEAPLSEIEKLGTIAAVHAINRDCGSVEAFTDSQWLRGCLARGTPVLVLTDCEMDTAELRRRLGLLHEGGAA